QKAGETRHFLDFYNGINYSRALTSAIKSTGSFKIMSTGRVQGPALKIIVDKEKEIRGFKSIPFWQIQLLCRISGQEIEAFHKQDKFWDKNASDEIYNKIKNEKKGIITRTEKKKIIQNPPVPFDLTTLQIETYRCLGIQPNVTLSLAQELYTSGYISYPRTSSQQLPSTIGYEKIIREFLETQNYNRHANLLLSKTSLTPNNGKKTDPAHPAIFPTGIIPAIEGRQEKLYDLIVKRFFAVFGDPAIRQSVSIVMDVKGEEFIASGVSTLEKGWHVLYEPYVKLEEKELPNVSNGDEVIVNKLNLLDKETQPPRRYTPASIIKELEKRNLGTKATRSEIVETLYKRGYVHSQSISATELGIKTIEALEKHCPKIIDEELTRHFEMEMEEIREDKKNTEEVLEEAKGAIIKIIEDFKSHEKDIGVELLSAERETQRINSFLGKCPKCNDGEIYIRKTKKSMFAGCNKYPECKTIYSLPKNTSIKSTNKQCEKCSSPIIEVVRNKRKQELCVNSSCESKQLIQDNEKVDTQCPKCKEGKLLIRNSIYGSFLGCSQYPKCRHTESVG
ncbi:MAG: DNA topoisomerase I, partial [Nanoarchaeota archaeon]